jgi:hypothetical protein
VRVCRVCCTGCINQFFTGSNVRLLEQIRLVLMEEDVPHEVDYSHWHRELRRHGFERIWKLRDTFEPAGNWSRNISHSAWRRGGRGALPTCGEFRAQKRLPRRWLDCLDPISERPMLP